MHYAISDVMCITLYFEPFQRSFEQKLISYIDKQNRYSDCYQDLYLRNKDDKRMILSQI